MEIEHSILEKFFRNTAITSLIILCLINFKCSLNNKESSEIWSDGVADYTEIDRTDELAEEGANLGIYFIVFSFVFGICIAGYVYYRGIKDEERILDAQNKSKFSSETIIWVVLGLLFILANFAGC